MRPSRVSGVASAMVLVSAMTVAAPRVPTGRRGRPSARRWRRSGRAKWSAMPVHAADVDAHAVPVTTSEIGVCRLVLRAASPRRDLCAPEARRETTIEADLWC